METTTTEKLEPKERTNKQINKQINEMNEQNNNK